MKKSKYAYSIIPSHWFLALLLLLLFIGFDILMIKQAWMGVHCRGVVGGYCFGGERKAPEVRVVNCHHSLRKFWRALTLLN